MLAHFIPLMIGAYLLGSFPSAYLAMKWSRGVDIRQQGTGKVGAANVLSTGRWWLAVPVAVFDIGKAALAVWVARLVGLDTAQQVTVGICTIIGHNWPVFLHFRGGRGVFASLGVITMMSPKLGLIVFVLPYLLAPVRHVALGVFLALVSLPFFAWFLTEPLDIEDRLPVALGLAAIAFIGLSRRLVAPRTSLSRSVPLAMVLVNRLLFDRDIADRKMWIRGLGKKGDPATDTPEQREEKA